MNSFFGAQPREECFFCGTNSPFTTTPTHVLYAVLRSLAVPITESDEAVAHLFSQLKLQASALDEFRQILAQGPRLDNSSID